jgi:hypothetical protein
MSESSNPSTSSRSGAAAGAQPPDLQQLVGLLGNLMPLLLRFQSQVLESPFQLGLAVPEAVIDHQAAVSLVEDMVTGALRSLSAYLDANAGQNAGLKNCVPIVTQATQCVVVRDYAQALNLIWMVYRAITAIGAADPRIPPLPPRGHGTDQPSSLH